MDPTATWVAMGEAYDRGDMATAFELATELLAWLMKGGFPPDGISVDFAKASTRLMRHQWIHREAYCADVQD